MSKLFLCLERVVAAVAFATTATKQGAKKWKYAEHE